MDWSFEWQLLEVYSPPETNLSHHVQGKRKDKPLLSSHVHHPLSCEVQRSVIPIHDILKRRMTEKTGDDWWRTSIELIEFSCENLSIFVGLLKIILTDFILISKLKRALGYDQRENHRFNSLYSVRNRAGYIVYSILCARHRVRSEESSFLSPILRISLAENWNSNFRFSILRD